MTLHTIPSVLLWALQINLRWMNNPNGRVLIIIGEIVQKGLSWEKINNNG